MKFVSKILPLAMAFSFAACVGGNNTGVPSYVPGGTTAPVSFGSTVTGQFVDAPVNGLNYWLNGNSSSKKRTSGDGNFTCSVGDFVTFALGNLELGTGPCGTVVTPALIQDISATDTVGNIALLLQKLGGGASAQTLNVANYAGADFSAAGTIDLLDETRLNGILTAVGKPTIGVGTFSTERTAAVTAMNQYINSINSIPESWYSKQIETPSSITATKVSGPADWCDDTVAFGLGVYVDSEGTATWEAFDEDDNTVSKGYAYSRTVYLNQLVDTDPDETYQIVGSATITDSGSISGSWVETTLSVTDSEDAAFEGTKCAYKFGPVQGEVSEYSAE